METKITHHPDQGIPFKEVDSVLLQSGSGLTWIPFFIHHSQSGPSLLGPSDGLRSDGIHSIHHLQLSAASSMCMCEMTNCKSLCADAPLTTPHTTAMLSTKMRSSQPLMSSRSRQIASNKAIASQAAICVFLGENQGIQSCAS